MRTGRPLPNVTANQHHRLPEGSTMTQRTTPLAALRRHRLGASLATAGLLVAGLATSAGAVVEPGTPAKDVTVGLDNDNAANPFIQPPGVTAKQHMDNTDVLFG